MGTAIRTCEENKKWTGNEPYCEKVMCPLPVAPTNGEIRWRGHRYRESQFFILENCLKVSWTLL